MNIPVRIRSNGLIGILVGVQLVPVAGPPQLGLDAKGELIQKGPQQTGLQPFGIIALRDGFAVGPLGDMQPLDPAEVEQALSEARTGEFAPEAEQFVQNVADKPPSGHTMSEEPPDELERRLLGEDAADA